MKLNRFCSKCGKTLNNSPTYNDGYLCDNCSGNKPVISNIPASIQVRRCIHCSAYSLKKEDQEFKWQYHPQDESDIDFLTRLLYQHIFYRLEEKYNQKYELFFEQQLNLIAPNEIRLVIQTTSHQENMSEENIAMKRKEIHCPYCAKKKGGRFDAIVQIRIQHEKNQVLLEEIMSDVKKIEEQENFARIENFISKLDTTTNGYDLMVSTNAMARVLTAKLRAHHHFEMKISKKLIGVDSEKGSDLYRQTTMLRLVPVLPKDYLKIENIAYIVKKITRNKIVLKNLETNKVSQVNYDIFQKKRWKFYEPEGEING